MLAELKAMVENDPRLYLLFNSMFDQVPHKKPYSMDPAGNHQVHHFDHMLQVLNHLMTTAPAWSDKGQGVGLVGLPFQALLDWPMATLSGFAVFLDPQVNAMLKKILNTWGEYLTNPESAKVLNTTTSGWLGQVGKKDLTTAANAAAETALSFEEIFLCDPSADYHGFTSWDHFFTRTFRDGVRPVAHPGDEKVVVNSCESMPYKVAYDVPAHDKFWIKGQPYSVMDMLAHDAFAEQFVGGTIYQAFLSALSYHHWHSPVSGRVVKTYVKDGTYYSEPPFTGFVDSHGPDSGGENTGQGYIAAVATRALIFIEADNPDIGLMCVMPVGMVEVSTCDVIVKQGQHVKKGEQLGMVCLHIHNQPILVHYTDA